MINVYRTKPYISTMRKEITGRVTDINRNCCQRKLWTELSERKGSVLNGLEANISLSLCLIRGECRVVSRMVPKTYSSPYKRPSGNIVMVQRSGVRSKGITYWSLCFCFPMYQGISFVPVQDFRTKWKKERNNGGLILFLYDFLWRQIHEIQVLLAGSQVVPKYKLSAIIL